MESEIKVIFKQIANALSNKEVDSALSYFSDCKYMIKISNGCVLRGKKQLSEYWHQSIPKINGLSIEVDNIEINKIDDNYIWTKADEHITLDGRSYDAIVTNIFKLTGSGWKILLDHTTSIGEK